MKLPISIGILSWNSNQTLRNTLKSYKENGLLDMVNDVTIFFQEVLEIDKQIAEEFSIPYIGANENIGIGKAFMLLAENAKSDYVMILEHDWELIENQKITYDRLFSGIKLIQDGYSSIRYRHRKNPGQPLFTEGPYKGNELNFYEPSTELLSPHLLDSIHWIDYPEQKFCDKIQKQNEYFITTSRWGNWTNNPCLYKKEFFLKTISQFIGTGIELESNISKWWAHQNFKVAHGEGLFTHNDIQKYGIMNFKNIAVFYHLFISEPNSMWNWWVDEQMNLLKSVGLTDVATVYVCITMPIGLINNKHQLTFDEMVIDYIKNEYPFVNIINVRGTQEQPNLYEGQTLKELYEYCKVNDGYVLYCHNKGMSSFGTHITSALKDWKNYMLYFNVEKWKDCVEKLDEGYDCVGVNWLRGENLSGIDFKKEHNFLANHFAGNFWWANAKYIRTLSDPLEPEKYCDIKWFMESMMTYRYAFEIWIGNLDTKYYCFHQSNTHHYFENYPREKYCND
jgi:hypothetical protein